MRRVAFGYALKVEQWSQPLADMQGAEMVALIMFVSEKKG
jgi:hypothetical protein